MIVLNVDVLFVMLMIQCVPCMVLYCNVYHVWCLYYDTVCAVCVVNIVICIICDVDIKMCTWCCVTIIMCTKCNINVILCIMYIVGLKNLIYTPPLHFCPL